MAGNLFNKFSKTVYDFINNGGLAAFLILAFFGISMSLTGMILWFVVYGFDWVFFIIDMLIVGFCGWALYQAFMTVKNNFEIFKKPLGLDNQNKQQ